MTSSNASWGSAEATHLVQSQINEDLHNGIYESYANARVDLSPINTDSGDGMYVLLPSKSGETNCVVLQKVNIETGKIITKSAVIAAYVENSGKMLPSSKFQPGQIKILLDHIVDLDDIGLKLIY